MSFFFMPIFKCKTCGNESHYDDSDRFQPNTGKEWQLDCHCCGKRIIYHVDTGACSGAEYVGRQL